MESPEYYTCGCPEGVEWVRHNPTTGRGILLCMAHADLHDQGHGFEVHEETVEQRMQPKGLGER